MSASSKKKLRNAQEAAKMTERQLAEQKEAKKIRIYTIAFVVVLVALLVIAITVGITQTISSSGIREKNTVAVTIGNHELSNADLSYYYIDTVNNFYSQNGSMAAMFGLDVTAPLNEQVMDETTGETWADYFLSSAKETAKSIYALCDAANAAGHTLSEDEKLNMESTISYTSLYASMYGYSDVESYLKAMYGNGATEEGYRNYMEVSMLADSYYQAYGDSLTYTDADLRAAEEENFDKYSSFTYNYYYLPASRFLTGGTAAEDGTTTYSDEEKAASVAACEAAAKALTGEEITSVEALDEAIAALPENTNPASSVSTYYEDNGYSSINSAVAQWLSEDSRVEGDKTYIANASGDTVNGYYIVYFHSVNDNAFPLKNVRHILISFEGGTTAEDGTVTYTVEEKDTAKKEAEALLEQWKNGEKTEDSFATLAKENSTDTGSIENGGLYEDIYPGQMVPAFEEWCFADGRKAGDTGIVETEYGYHVMYFAGNSELTYRDYQIRKALASADLSAWYTELQNNATVADGDTRYMKTDLVLSGN